MKKVKIKRKTKNTDIIKNIENHILCIILKEGKGSEWIWLPEDQDKFSIDNNTYFKTDDGTYLKNTLRFFVYLEGISLPIHHGYIDREEITKEYTDKDTGKTKTITITKIKGLNFDSKVIDILLNRNLADEFTKQHMDIPNLAIILLLVANLITNIIGIGMWFL